MTHIALKLIESVTVNMPMDNVSDLLLPEGVELLTSAELSVVSVVAPREEEEVAPETELEGIEGEVAEGEEGAADGDADAGASEGEGKEDRKES